MKRFASLFISLMLMLALVSIGITQVSAGTVDDKDYYPLFAGQSTEIGRLEVWNNATDLYVRFVLEEGWEMTESHLAVVGDVSQIPVATNTLNAVPGKFTYKQMYDPAVTETMYVIAKSELVGITGSSMVLAAHAEVRHFTPETLRPELTWMRTVESDDIDIDANVNEVHHTTGFGGSWTYSEVMPYLTNLSSVNVWDNGIYHGPVVPGVAYASWKYAYTIPDGGGYDGASDLRLFRATFNVPENYVIQEAKLGVVDYLDRIPINDNLYIYVNEELLMWGGTRASVINAAGGHAGTNGILAIQGSNQHETGGWYLPGTFPSIDNLLTGMNKLEIFVEENEQWGGLGKLDLNMTGLLYDRYDSAWAAHEIGSPLINTTLKGNWATYVEYDFTLEEPVLLNGDFENPTFGTLPWYIYNDETPGLGWRVAWTDALIPGIAHLELQTESAIDFQPYHGLQHAELDSSNSVRIYQDIATMAMQDYELSFSWSARSGGLVDGLEVYWDGVLVGTYADSTDIQTWHEVVLHDLMASTALTRLEFREIGSSNGSGTMLDYVLLSLDD